MFFRFFNKGSNLEHEMKELQDFALLYFTHVFQGWL